MGPTITVAGSPPSIAISGTTYAANEFWDSGLFWDNGGFWDSTMARGAPMIGIGGENISIATGVSLPSIATSMRKPSGSII